MHFRIQLATVGARGRVVDTFQRLLPSLLFRWPLSERVIRLWRHS